MRCSRKIIDKSGKGYVEVVSYININLRTNFQVVSYININLRTNFHRPVTLWRKLLVRGCEETILSRSYNQFLLKMTGLFETDQICIQDFPAKLKLFSSFSRSSNGTNSNLFIEARDFLSLFYFKLFIILNSITNLSREKYFPLSLNVAKHFNFTSVTLISLYKYNPQLNFLLPCLTICNTCNIINLIPQFCKQIIASFFPEGKK